MEAYCTHRMYIAGVKLCCFFKKCKTRMCVYYVLDQRYKVLRNQEFTRTSCHDVDKPRWLVMACRQNSEQSRKYFHDDDDDGDGTDDYNNNNNNNNVQQPVAANTEEQYCTVEVHITGLSRHSW